jgi:hypothetical protein
MSTPHGMLSVTGFREDGAALTQIWIVSDNDRAFLTDLFMQKLGQPHSETIATPDGVEALSDLIAGAPGHVTTFTEQP